MGPKGKHIFGMVKVGEKGQIVIPKDARTIFNIKSGDSLLVFGDEDQGIALVKSEGFLQFAEAIFNAKEYKEDEE
jgi:AbrB family looped-hinge helix DNA binding protein